MHVLRLFFITLLCSFAVKSYSSDFFEFTSQKYQVHIENDHIWFTDIISERKTGPELYRDETDPDFFTLIKDIISWADTHNENIFLYYKSVTSKRYGSYDEIIPDF